MAAPTAALRPALIAFLVLAVASFLALFVDQRIKLNRPLLVEHPTATKLVPNGYARVAGVRFRVVHHDLVTVVIVNASGTTVRTLLHDQPVGDKGLVNVPWDGRNDGGQLVTAGVYTPRVTLVHAGRSGPILSTIKVVYKPSA
jgi:hypothetical protein